VSPAGSPCPACGHPPTDEQGESVLNGIAYLPQTQHLLVTGKLWPRMYEIELTNLSQEDQPAQ